MKRVWMKIATIVVALSTIACDGLLDMDDPEQDVSTLTEDVNFVAESVICKRFDNVYADFYRYDNYFFEMVGEDKNGVKDVMILDLLVPDGTSSPVGEYKVGFVGNYIALAKLDLFDPNTGMLYYGGCYYGRADGGVVNEYYGFLTEGKVTISSLEDEYFITVDAKSEEHNVYVYYHGPLNVVLSK